MNKTKSIKMGMKGISMILMIIAFAITSCKKEKDPINAVTPQTNNGITKNLKVVVTSNPQTFWVEYMPNNSSQTYEWRENSTTGTLERDVVAKKDSTLNVFVYGDFITHHSFSVKIYEGSTLVKSFSKGCKFAYVTYKVE